MDNDNVSRDTWRVEQAAIFQTLYYTSMLLLFLLKRVAELLHCIFAKNTTLSQQLGLVRKQMQLAASTAQISFGYVLQVATH